MEHLAFIFFIVTSPPSMEGVVIESNQPERCIQESERVMALFEEQGVSMDMRCVYTHAPAFSPRPKLRPGDQ